MDSDLKSLRIERPEMPEGTGSRWAVRWIIGGIVVFAVLGASATLYKKVNAATEVETVRVTSPELGAASDSVLLNATGYIVAAHKIELASKVVGKVKWIGVEKGDHVREGQELVRLEDDEYQAQVQQARGNLANLQAKLAELEHGSRPEEIAAAKANVEEARADLVNAKVNLDRTRQLVADKVMSKQSLDDADARFQAAQAKVNSLQKTFELVKIGPRVEQVDAIRGQVEQAKGALAFAQTQLSNTIIRAPVTGVILERAVEKGEFVTTSFVGDRGAKGYVVSLADLNDLDVELDISQNDFAKLGPQQRGVVTVDAYSDAKWSGHIREVSPEANRQKATVQVKVKIEKPDDRLRPEMNASVAFLSSETQKGTPAESQHVVYVPSSTVRDGKVFVVYNGHVAERKVTTGALTPQGLRVEEGLTGGEDLVVNPPAEMKDGMKVQPKGANTK